MVDDLSDDFLLGAVFRKNLSQEKRCKLKRNSALSKPGDAMFDQLGVLSRYAPFVPFFYGGL